MKPVELARLTTRAAPRVHGLERRAIQRDEPMTIHGSGENVRDWLHVEDHCRGLLAALARGIPGETYNFGGLCERTNLQIAFLLNAVMRPHSPPQVQLVGDRPGNDLRYSTSVQKAAAALGWLPGPGISTRIDDVVRWYCANPDYELDYGR